MKTSIFLLNGQWVAVFEGRLDTTAASMTEQEVRPLYGCNGEDIILDCAQLQYISSSGLRIFLGILKAAKPKGSRVYIRNINDDLKAGIYAEDSAHKF